MEMQQVNIFDEPIEECCSNPITGFFRDGFCHTDQLDRGLHIVCSLMSDEFLSFSKSRRAGVSRNEWLQKKYRFAMSSTYGILPWKVLVLSFPWSKSAHFESRLRCRCLLQISWVQQPHRALWLCIRFDFWFHFGSSTGPTSIPTTSSIPTNGKRVSDSVFIVIFACVWWFKS